MSLGLIRYIVGEIQSSTAGSKLGFLPYQAELQVQPVGQKTRLGSGLQGPDQSTPVPDGCFLMVVVKSLFRMTPQLWTLLPPPPTCACTSSA